MLPTGDASLRASITSMLAHIVAGGNLASIGNEWNPINNVILWLATVTANVANQLKKSKPQPDSDVHRNGNRLPTLAPLPQNVASTHSRRMSWAPPCTASGQHTSLVYQVSSGCQCPAFAKLASIPPWCKQHRATAGASGHLRLRLYPVSVSAHSS